MGSIDWRDQEISVRSQRNKFMEEQRKSKSVQTSIQHSILASLYVELQQRGIERINSESYESSFSSSSCYKLMEW